MHTAAHNTLDNIAIEIYVNTKLFGHVLKKSCVDFPQISVERLKTAKSTHTGDTAITKTDLR